MRTGSQRGKLHLVNKLLARDAVETAFDTKELGKLCALFRNSANEKGELDRKAFALMFKSAQVDLEPDVVDRVCICNSLFLHFIFFTLILNPL